MDSNRGLAAVVPVARSRARREDLGQVRLQYVYLNRGWMKAATVWLVLHAGTGASSSCGGAADDPAQCSALVSLFHATGGPQWNRSSGWLGGGSYCTWAGVTCSGRDVVALNLTKNSLSGTLPPTLPAVSETEHAAASPAAFYPVLLHSIRCNFSPCALRSAHSQLANLTELNLWSNELVGHIPDNLARLAKLRDLNIYVNALSGTIPWEVGLMRGLVGFRAAHNQLSGTIPCIGSLGSLEALHLFNNKLSGGLELAELGQLPRLQQLDLANNELSGAVPSSLCVFVNRTKQNMTKSPMTCNLGGPSMKFSCPLPCGIGPSVCDAACVPH